MSPVTKGVLHAIACSAAVGLHVVFSKLALQQTAPTTSVTYLMSFAAIFSLVGIRTRSWPPLPKPALVNVFVHSLLATVGVVCTWRGLSHLNATVATFVGRTEVIISIALSTVILNEQLTLQRSLGFLVGLGGVLIMSWPQSAVDSWWEPGIVYMLVAGFSFGSCEIFTKKAVPHIPIALFVLMRNSIMASLLWINLCVRHAPLHTDLTSLSYIAAAAFLGPFLARYFFIHAIKSLPLSVVVGLNQTQPLFAAMFGTAIGFALPTSRQWVGGILIICGCLFLLARSKRATMTLKT